VLGAAAPGVHSQETSKVAKSELEEVTVTGSLIKGTPETAAQPVEVMTEEEIRNLGRPSNLELVKLMSEVGQVAGEANRFNAYPIGAETINLRNIGSRFTTVIFNGRRFPEQFGPATGRFNNIAWIPNAAVSRVEILKQGGAATYGADAVGGVVNYITRRDANGFEVSGDYTRIADDDGDYNADITWGNKFSNGNLLLVAAYQHRSMLDANDRDWAQKDFLENPNWSAAGSPGSYIFMTTPGTASTGAITPLSGYTGDQQMSITGLVRDPSCTALGGFAGWSATPSPACYVRAVNFDHLVEEQDQYQMYGEYNVEFANDLKLHVEGLYYQLDLPNIANSPSDAPGSWPLTTTRDASGLLTRQAAGVSPAYFVSGQNPAVADFLNNRFFNSNGTRAFTAAQIASVVNTGKVGLAQAIWRPFAYGGNPLHGETDLQQNNQKVYRMTTELTGSLPEFWGSRLSWNTAVTYSKVTYDVSAEDMLVDRLQAALNGFGGTSCNNIRAGLAGSQCEWFNPFGTAIQRNIYTGAGNPNYISGLANSNDLVKWLYVPIKLHRDYGLYVFDGLISGDTGWQMPGGPVAVAFGTQFRYTQERFQIDDYSNIQVNPCATVGVTDCVNRTGPLVFGRQVSVLGTTRNSDRFYPVAAGFAEVQVPILKSLNLQLAGRYEKFYSDVTDIDNSTFVPAAAIKWDPLPWVGARASWGRTFSQVNPPVNDGPVVATAGANNAFAGIQGYTTQNFDNVNVQSENGDYLDFGLLFDVGNFNASIDYWELNVDQYTRTMTVNQVLRALIGPGVAPTTATPLNCSSPLFNPQAGFDNAAYVVLPAGRTCGQAGAATLGDVGAGWGINYFGGTNESNSGKLETAGVDFSASYRFEMAGLSVTPSVDLTYNTKWKLGDFVVGGVTVAPGYEGLGQANRTTGRLNLAVPRYRGSVALLFKSGRHTLNLLVNYIPSVRNEDPTDFDVTNDQNANIGNGNGFTTTGTTAATVACTSSASGLTTNLGNVPGGASTGQFGGASIVTNATTGQPTPSVTTRGFCANQNVAVLSGREIASTTNVDLTYRLELPAELSMSLTVNNLFGDDPSFDRALVAYNSGFGSPLGRTYKLGLRKKF
jgi:iron complex outermembrane receptor protein